MYNVKKPNNICLGNHGNKRTLRLRLRKTTLAFGTWNVQGISKKLTEVVSEIKNNGIDVAVITETKKKGHGSESLGDYDLFYSGVPKHQRAQQGVAILIRKKFRKNIKNWEAINARMIKMNLTMHGHRVTILGVYGVNDDATIALKDQFFEELDEEVVKVGSGREVLVLGDLNGRTGSRVNSKIVGPFGEVTVNDNGSRIIDVCEQRELKVLNGFYQHKDIHKYTWVQPTRGLRSIIDYVLVKQITSLKIQQVRVCRGLSCGSDHYFLRADVAFPARVSQNDRGDNQQPERQCVHQVKYNIDSLKHPSVKALYAKRLDEKLGDTCDGSTEERYEFIKNCVHSAAAEALGVSDQKNDNRKPYWWDAEVEEEINVKRNRYHQFLSSQKLDDKIVYRQAQARVRRVITRKKNEAWEESCMKINTYLGGRKSTEGWKVIKGLRRNKMRDIISPVPIDKMEDYFKDLLTERRPEFQGGVISTKEGSNVEIQLQDVVKAVRELKTRRAPGPGGIPAELIKCGTGKLFEHLRKLMQDCLHGSEIPKDWKESWITPSHKKGSKQDCDNYRGISVTGTLSKVYGKILKAKVEEVWSGQEAEEQAGFRAGRSTVDHLFTITQVIEKKRAVSQELHLVFVDLQKAYDSVPLVKLWEALEKRGFSKGLVGAIKSFYNGTIARVKSRGELSGGFFVTKGLKQGCCLSPTLFKVYLEHVLKEWKNKVAGMGVPLLDGQTLYTLCFADDQIVVAQDEEDADYMTRKLVEEYRKWGMDVSVSKTEKLVVGAAHQRQSIELEDGRRIEECDEYKYLGVWLDQDGRMDRAIKDRIIQGRRAIAMLNGVLWDQSISKANKHRIYDAIVKSIVLYGSEVWPLTKRTQEILRATEMDFWRRSAGISRRDRVRNERIRQVMKVEKDIVHDVMSRQLCWYGHVQRMSEERLPKQVLDWVPPGKRRRGRPVKGWRQGVDEEMLRCQLPDNLWEDRHMWRLGVVERQSAL